MILGLIVAQLVSPLTLPSVDTSALASKSEVQAAASAASAAQAAIPPVCSTIPPKDTLTGSIGSALACTPRSDRTALLDVQTGNTTLGADCSFSFTFARSFTSASPFVYAAVVNSSSTQMPCKIQARSATGASGTCAPAQTVALNLAAVTAGLNVAPFGTTCTAGTPVMFVGREPTQ